MLIITQTGRILYISENAAEYLGHSMVIIPAGQGQRGQIFDISRRIC